MLKSILPFFLFLLYLLLGDTFVESVILFQQWVIVYSVLLEDHFRKTLVKRAEVFFAISAEQFHVT